MEDRDLSEKPHEPSIDEPHWIIIRPRSIRTTTNRPQKLHLRDPFRHRTLIQAETEAARLAEMRRGETFVVYGRIGSATVPLPVSDALILDVTAPQFTAGNPHIVIEPKP